MQIAPFSEVKEYSWGRCSSESCCGTCLKVVDGGSGRNKKLTFAYKSITFTIVCNVGALKTQYGMTEAEFTHPHMERLKVGWQSACNGLIPQLNKMQDLQTARRRPRDARAHVQTPFPHPHLCFPYRRNSRRRGGSACPTR